MNLGPVRERVARQRVNARIRKKFLRRAERLFVDACRLYASRPDGDGMELQFARLAEELLSVNLMLTFHQWSRVGPSRLRQSSVIGVDVTSVAETEGRLRLSGTVRWSRRHSGREAEVAERFHVECEVPTSKRARKSIRPTIAVEVADDHAA